MYHGKKIIALVPARAGSKSVPGKNHAIMADKPLVVWTFQAAKKCPLIDEIICSTNDPKVAQLAQQHHITLIKRPERLATDTTPMLEVVLHLLEVLKKKKQHFDYLVLLQPTSPLRTHTDITKAIKQAIELNASSLASVTKLNLRPGLLLFGTKKADVLRTRSLVKSQADHRRQDALPIYSVNGAVYVWKFSFLRPGVKLNSPSYGMVLARTHTPDVDSLQDFERCEKALLRRNHS